MLFQNKRTGGKETPCDSFKTKWIRTESISEMI